MTDCQHSHSLVVLFSSYSQITTPLFYGRFSYKPALASCSSVFTARAMLALQALYRARQLYENISYVISISGENGFVVYKI